MAVDIGGENRFVRFKNRRCAALWHDADKVVQQAGVIHIKRGKSVADDKVVFGQMAAQGGKGSIKIAVAYGFAPLAGIGHTVDFVESGIFEVDGKTQPAVELAARQRIGSRNQVFAGETARLKR